MGNWENKQTISVAALKSCWMAKNQVARFKIPSHIIRDLSLSRSGGVLVCKQQSVSYWTKTKLQAFGHTSWRGMGGRCSVAGYACPGMPFEERESDMSEILQS